MTDATTPREAFPLCQERKSLPSTNPIEKHVRTMARRLRPNHGGVCWPTVTTKDAPGGIGSPSMLTALCAHNGIQTSQGVCSSVDVVVAAYRCNPTMRTNCTDRLR